MFIFKNHDKTINVTKSNKIYYKTIEINTIGLKNNNDDMSYHTIDTQRSSSSQEKQRMQVGKIARVPVRVGQKGINGELLNESK